MLAPTGPTALTLPIHGPHRTETFSEASQLTPRTWSPAERLPIHAMYCALAGVLGGWAGAWATSVLSPGALDPTFAVLTTTLAALGAVEGWAAYRRRSLGTCAGIAVGAAMASLLTLAGDALDWATMPMAATFGLLAALAVLLTPARGAARLSRALCSGLTTTVGVLVATALFIDSAAPSFLSAPMVAEAGVGASLGFFFGLGGVLAAALSSYDAVARAWQRTGRRLQGEPGEVAQRAVRLHREIQGLAATSEVQAVAKRVWLHDILTIADKTTLHIMEVGAHLGATDVSARCNIHPVRARLHDLHLRIEHTSDTHARAEYQAAAHSLALQLRHARQLDGERERLVARLHRGLSALERLRWMMVEKARQGDARLRFVLPHNTSVPEHEPTEAQVLIASAEYDTR